METKKSHAVKITEGTLNIREKLAILADAAKYDASCASSGVKRESKGKLGNSEGMGICHSYTPDGRCISLLKILMTNHCIFDCTYCINRVSSDIRRAKFSVDEVVWLTIEFYKRNYIEGLFLSSGIYGTPDETMEELIQVVKKLRQEQNFAGYIHLKAVAGCSADLVAQAGWWADRLSANIELPQQVDLDKYAPAKSHKQIEGVMANLSENIKEASSKTLRSTLNKGRKKPPHFAKGGQSTQMIVGASDSSDLKIMQKANFLYQDYGLRRVYYSAFSPIPASDPRLPVIAPPLVREHRLYQADWLLRYYGYKVDELATESNGNFSLERDPKLAWALANRGFFPVDINKASRWQLLRIPGLGVRNTDRIIKARKFNALKIEDLKKMRVALARAKYFILTADYNPDVAKIDSLALDRKVTPQYTQPTLFEWAASANSGEI